MKSNHLSYILLPIVLPCMLIIGCGSEWRTPPLWGIGLIRTVNGHTNLLHDGRARGVLEAILWHGGEAEQSRQAVQQMSTSDREALIAFLESL